MLRPSRSKISSLCSPSCRCRARLMIRWTNWCKTSLMFVIPVKQMTKLWLEINHKKHKTQMILILVLTTSRQINRPKRRHTSLLKLYQATLWRSWKQWATRTSRCFSFPRQVFGTINNSWRPAIYLSRLDMIQSWAVSHKWVEHNQAYTHYWEFRQHQI